MTKSLFKIGMEMREIESQIEEAGGEITIDEELLISTLSKALTTKADGIVEFVKSKENDLAAINQRIKEFTELKKRVEKNLAKFNEYVVTCMDLMGVDKIEGQLNKVSIRKPSKVVNITNEAAIPEKYIIKTTTERIDKQTLKEDLKLGNTIGGAILGDGTRKATFKI